MNTSFNFSELSLDSIMVWVIAALLIMVAAMLQWPALKNKLRERKLIRVIKKFGRETMHDVMLPDGLGDFTYIENLVLTANAIVVLYLKRYRGVIFAGEQIDEWTQVLNNHSYRFPNPLQKVEMDTMAIRNLVPATEVQGLIVFTQGSEFPKGKPGNVMLFSEFEAGLKDFKAGELPAALHTAWKKLVEQAQPCSKEFISRMREDDSQQGHGVLASVFVIAALVWLGWHFI